MTSLGVVLAFAQFGLLRPNLTPLCILILYERWPVQRDSKNPSCWAAAELTDRVLETNDAGLCCCKVVRQVF